MTKNNIIEAIKSGDFSNEELVQLKKTVDIKIDEVERSEKVRLFSLRHCGCTSYFMTAKEVNIELIKQIQEIDGDDIVGSQFNVGALYISKNNLSEYLGKTHI